MLPDVDTRQKQKMCKMLYVIDSKLGEVAGFGIDIDPFDDRPS